MGGIKSIRSVFILIITLIFLSIVGQGFAVQQTEGKIIYVNVSNDKGPFDGKSWGTAFKDLQDAIKESNAGDQIWVAKGTYYPTESADRDIFFILKDGVKLYGGFRGNETDIKQRNWTKYITTLNANIGDKKTNIDNSYHVVVGADNALLDGFVVKDGYSLDAPSFSFPGKDADEKGTAAEIHITPQHILRGMDRGTGAGILLYQALTNISNCTFENNIAGKGGGMYIMLAKDEPESKLYKGPTISDCKFINNYAYRRGGGVSIDLHTAPTFVRCEFINNRCEEKGGAMYNDFGAQTNLTNCLFAGNVALSGSAMGNDGGYRGSIDHCTFVNNVAKEVGPALYLGSGGSNNPTVINSIIWSNTCENDEPSIFSFRFSRAYISYSCVEGGYPGEGNIDKDPKFENPANGNFRLSDMSPCIDSGFEDVSRNYDLDLDGNPRFYDDKKRPNQLSAVNVKAAIDMGAYERQADSKVNPVDIIYVSAGQNTGLYDGSSWSNAMNLLQDAMDKAYAAGAEVWVAKGVYTPTDTLKREIPFFLREGVEVYGGFQGTETKREQRNPLMYMTIFSGDIGIRGYNEDNSYHVLIAANNALLDGVTIADGNANALGTPHHDQGAGLFISQRGIADASGGRGSGGLSLTLKNCTFTNNNAIHGGAVYCQDMCSGKFINCTFTNNTAETAGAVYDVIAVKSSYENCYFVGNYAKFKGGAMYIDYGARPTIKNSKFEYNIAGAQGGAIATISRASQVENTIVKIDDTVFSNNQAGNQGGAIYNYDASFITLTDCQIVNNRAVNGAGAVATVFASETTLTNCTVRGNTSVKGNNDFIEEIRSKNIINNGQ